MAANKNAAKTTPQSSTATSKTTGTKGKATAAATGPSAFDLLKAQHKDLRVRAQKLGRLLSKEVSAHASPSKSSAKSGQKAIGQKNGHNGQGNGAHDEGQASHEGEDSILLDLKSLAAAWVQHSMLEENVVFPALEEAGVSAELLEQAEIQRDLAILLLDDMVDRAADDELLRAEAAVLCEMIPRIARFEESKLFTAAKRSGMDASELGRQVQQHSRAEGEEQNDQAEENNDIPRPRHLRGVETSNSKEYVTMPMRGQERDRDERGRFTDDDDHRGRSRGGSSSRSSGRSSGRHDDDGDNRGWHGDSQDHSEASRRGWDERRGGGGSYGRGRHDDDEHDGRYSRGRSSNMSHSGGGSSGRGRYDDDEHDGRYSRGRSLSMSRSGGGGRRTGGWFGDSDGHSEASRRGWQNSDHGDSGWFGDREGHSEASRRGWQNPDHGDSGWFGDREGHAQASRRGWQNSDHGDSGWFGDPEGHSEASRRGWRTRRDEDDDYDDRRRSRRGGGGRD